jgi:2-C-methyl-D-erythritol 4-phosphate cytidylyltransferase
VVAAGSGQRFGGPKQFFELDGISVAERSVTLCRSVAEVVVLVTLASSTQESYGADFVVAGGATRSGSVRAGLAVLPEDLDVVVIHDAARPLASERLFFSVVAELANEGVDAAIPGLPLADTIKWIARRDARAIVVETLVRDELVAVQTPQAFRSESLRRAHEQGGEATDDAALIESLGGTVVVVAGEAENFKITQPSDLDAAERIAERRR